jgi:hypothetical protein
MNTKKVLTGLALAGGLYALWRFVIKPKIAESEAKKMVNDYKLFDTQKELIASALPQENKNDNE